jgi:tetratricopeptide (TPR) repeat protein
MPCSRLSRAAPHVLRGVGLAVLLTAGIHAQESGTAAGTENSARVVSPPSTLSKTLRAFGLETPPGKRGDKAYHKGDYEEALRQYGKATEETAVPSPLLNRNIGNALYRQKRYPEAADYFERALKGSSGAGSGPGTNGRSAREARKDSSFASSTHHNLGNTFYRKAAAADSSAAEAAIADLREAVAHYKKALQMERGNRDAKQNLEMSNAMLQRLLARQQQQPQQQKQEKPPEPSARAKEALARALQLVQERRYPEAAKVLDDIMRTDRTAVSFGAHRKRLDDVMKILRGETPADPSPRDPRAAPFSPGAPGATGGWRGP